MDQLIAGDPPFIGPYRLVARLGAGGMGLVYLGRSEQGRTVAVKVVQAEYAGNPEFRRRFAREVAAARQVGGSWTAAVLDGDPAAPVPWVATQYIPGPDLHTVVGKDFGPLPEHSVRVLANRLGLALQAVHGAGLIHRDLKPSNVLVTVDGPRVIDFGIARAMDSLTADSLLTRTGMLIGSPGFMSPEQVRGLELTSASDVFCLGAVLVYAATGRLLFGAGDSGLHAHLFRVAEDEPDLTGVPAGLVDLVRACLHKAPAERPTLQEVVERSHTDEAAEWLPSPVLAQLGRHAAELLDFAPVVPPQAPVAPPIAAQRPAPSPTPTPVPAPGYAPGTPPTPYPAYTPTTPVGGAQRGFGPPMAPGPGGWGPAPVPVPVPGSAAPHPGRWAGLGALVLAQLLVGLQVGTFNVSLPAIRATMGIGFGQLSWLAATSTLAFAAVVVLGGQVSDVLGRRPVLTVGLGGLALASVLAGLASNPTMMFTARALAGFGGALVTAAALALVVTNFPDLRERRTALGIYAAVVGCGTALGFLVGGSFAVFLSWRMGQFAVVPLAVLALIGALTLLRDEVSGSGARVDPAAVAFGTVGMLVLTFGINRAPYLGRGVALVLVLVVGVPLFGAFLWRRSGRADALPPQAGTDLSRLGAGVALVFAGAALFAVFSSVSLLLQVAYHYSPFVVGLSFLPLVVAVLVGGLVSGRLTDRVAARALIVPGLALTALGLVLLTFAWGGGGFTFAVLPGLLLVGFGTGWALTPLFAVATSGIAPCRAGAASSTVGAALQVGAAVGGGLFSVPEMAFESRYATALWSGVGVLVLGGLAAGLMITSGPTDPVGPPQDRMPVG